MRTLCSAALALNLLQGKGPAPSPQAPVGQHQQPTPQRGADSAKKDATEPSAPVARTTPDAEERVADYTRWLTWLTGGLVVANLLLWWTTRGTLKHLNREFVSTHRPKIRVRNFVVRPLDGRPLFAPGDVVLGQFYFVNVGDTAATITESGCWVHWRRGGLPMERPYGGKAGNNPATRQSVVKPGESFPALFESDEPMDTYGPLIVRGFEEHRLWIMGWIEYRDDIGTPRRTSFCREYDPDTGRFVAARDQDYEHEE